jgi:hypothetical protein
MLYRLSWLGVSLFCYGLAQALPCLMFLIVPNDFVGKYIPSGKLNAYGAPIDLYDYSGIELTIAGLFGLLFMQIPPALGWLANPAYWLSSVFFMQQKYLNAAIVGSLAVIIGYLGTISAFWYDLPNGSSPNSHLALDRLLAGFWVWLAAPGVIALASVIQSVILRRQ